MKKILQHGQRDYLTMEIKSGLRVVVVNGMPGSGKTSFEEICKEKAKPYCQVISTIDVIKTMARIGGWRGEKTPKARKLLSDLKDLWTEYNDLSFVTIVNYINKWEEELGIYGVRNQPHVLFVDSREPEEIKRFKDELGAVSVLIRRPSVESSEQSNHADANVLDYEYDWVLWNSGSKKDLENLASGFLDLIFNKN